MLKRLIKWVAARRPLRTISINGDDYLRRYYLFGRFIPEYFQGRPLLGFLPFTAYLHHFVRPDLDRELHNHPFDKSFALILSGGYDEERLHEHTFDGQRTIGGYVGVDTYRSGAINIIAANDFHRVASLRQGVETWTLFITGRKVQTWGFRLDDGTFVRWREFLGVRKDEGSDDE